MNGAGENISSKRRTTVFQAKGLDHCKEMQNQAWYCFEESPLGTDFRECLKFVIERHRKSVEKEIKNVEEQSDYAG